MSVSIEIDSFDCQTWERYAQEFADYNIYQTWPYQDNRCKMSRQQISRAIVRDNTGSVCLMCHVRIKKIPLLGLRVGHVQWGPLVLKKDRGFLCGKEVFIKLRNAYLSSKVDVLRLVPNLINNENGSKFSEILSSSGFEHVKSVKPYRTFIIRCDSEEEIRKNFSKSFKRNLKKAEKAKLEIKNGINEEYSSILGELYIELKKRKEFAGLDICEFLVPQSILSLNEKMHFTIVYVDGIPSTALLSTNLGDKAIILLAASNELSRKNCGAELAWYQGVMYAKKMGMKWCDLGGIDPDKNPNVYRYKSRMGGEDVFHIGCYEACSSLLKKTFWQILEKAYRVIKK